MQFNYRNDIKCQLITERRDQLIWLFLSVTNARAMLTLITLRRKERFGSRH